MTAPPPDFLIVGMQKSGSYWLTALLDAHPQIRCFPALPGHADGTGEAHLFDNLPRIDNDYVRFRKSMSAKLGRWFADVIPAQQPATAGERDALVSALRVRFNEYCDEQRRQAGKPLVGEKTTETVHHPDLVARLYPGLRTVCILRDPRDRAVSFFYHQQRKGRLAADAVLTVADAESYIARVRQDYEGLLRMPDPIHVLTYEQLAAAPRETTHRLLAFLGADTAPAVIDAMIEAAAFERLAGRRAGDADPGSHFRQGKPGDFVNHLGAVRAARMEEGLAALTRRVEQRFGLDLAAYRLPAGPASEVAL